MSQSCSIKFGSSFAYVTSILFMYRDVLKIQLPWLDDVQPAKKPKHPPVVFTREDVRSLLAQLDSTLAHGHAHVRSRFETAGLFATEHTRWTHIDFYATDHGIDARSGRVSGIDACPSALFWCPLLPSALF